MQNFFLKNCTFIVLVNVSSCGNFQHFLWRFPQVVCTILSNHPRSRVRDSRFLHSVLLSQLAIKDPPPSSWATHAHLDRKIPAARKGNTFTEQQWTPVTAWNVSFLFMFLCFLYFIGSLLQFKTYELLSSWNLQLRRILQLHKLCLHYMQEE